MKNEFTAKVSMVIQTPTHVVWDALVNPDKLKKYTLGSDVLSDWKVG